MLCEESSFLERCELRFIVEEIFEHLVVEPHQVLTGQVEPLRLYFLALVFFEQSQTCDYLDKLFDVVDVGEFDSVNL